MNVGKGLRLAFAAVFFVAAGFVLFILIIALTDYRPEKESVLTDMPAAATLNVDTITILTWNIGYAGLDRNMDFFHDGGSKTRTGKRSAFENLEAITAFIAGCSADFVFMQEVDRNSTRSYAIDILSAITAKMPLYAAFYGTNYRALFVPVPLRSPMGRVESGIATLSRYIPRQSVRYSYPSKQPFPRRLFLLDRCFIMCRYPLRNGQSLILINTHNSAFDDDGEQRRDEMLALKNFIIAEYERGNYIIVGGDWNQIPPLESAKPYIGTATEHFAPRQISGDFMPPSWKWISDGNPTNRFLDMPYIKGVTKETLLDFFLTSPNVETLHTQRIDGNYRYSDHNPVVGTFILKQVHPN
jgi:endonuclease/exonuclease/phosphatase family metal-dependent hydrolase